MSSISPKQTEDKSQGWGESLKVKAICPKGRHTKWQNVFKEIWKSNRIYRGAEGEMIVQFESLQGVVKQTFLSYAIYYTHSVTVILEEWIDGWIMAMILLFQEAN